MIFGLQFWSMPIYKCVRTCAHV